MRLTLFLSLVLLFHAAGARAAVDEARIAEVLRSVDAVVANSSEFIVKKEGEIEFTITALNDVKVARPESFAAIQDITL